MPRSFSNPYQAPRENGMPIHTVSCPDFGELSRNCSFYSQPKKSVEKAKSPGKSVSWKNPLASSS